jgi:hypothetical protein
MTDKEFGIWMMENLELALHVEAELRAAGRMVEEDGSDEAVVHNAMVLIGEMKRRCPERFPDEQAGAQA